MPDAFQQSKTRPYIRTLPEAECLELLAVATVGRFGFVSDAGPQIIPVDFRLGAGPRIFARIGSHGMLAQLAERESRVAFEVDYHASDFVIAWSVLMQGTISFLDAAATAAYAELRRRPVPWPGSANSVPIQFVPTAVSGRGLHRMTPD